MASSDSGAHDLRLDPHLGTRVHVVASRQSRPNLPSVGCPFCVGGLEAPEPYEVRWFPNRWPAMPDDRCEMILFSPEHDASLGSLGPEGVRKVIDLWATRTEALGSRDDVAFVLIFENRGREVGATIDHPHGQIYAYPHVPERPARRIAAGWEPDPNPGDRFIADNESWLAWVPYAPTFPIEINLAPRQRVGTLIELDDQQRDDLARLLGAVLAGLDRIYDETLPYMMWFNQAPFPTADTPTLGDQPPAWLQIEIVSPRRSPGVSRFIASAEVACQEYFLPITPEQVAAQLRSTIEF